jgi:hypothetical protein
LPFKAVTVSEAGAVPDVIGVARVTEIGAVQRPFDCAGYWIRPTQQ